MRAAEAVLPRFRRARILVAGDLMLDQFIWGEVERISPEAPVPVVRVRAEDFRLGGAANVVQNLRALGGEVEVCGVVGNDPAGRRLLGALAETGAALGGVVRGRAGITVQKARIIAHRQQVVRLDREDDAAVAGSRAAQRARGYLLARLWRADAVVLSDYGKGLVTPELLAALAALRCRRPFVLVVDPKRRNFPHYRRPTLVTPNREEASQAAGVDIRDAATLEQAGQILLERWAADAVLITRGAEGMTLFRPGRPSVHFPTAARRVFDVTGAGDTVVAACALALAVRAPLEVAAVLANHAAGLVVAEVGTASVSVERLRAALRADNRRARSGGR